MPVYDDEEQKVNTGNPGDEELRRLTGIGTDEEGTMDREAHNGAAADIAEREGLFNKTGDTGKGTDAGLFNEEGDDPKRLSGARGAVGRLKNRKNNLVQSIGKHKWLWGLGAGAAGSVLGLIFLIFILLGALKIPHLAENITAYQFARVFQRSAETNERIVSTKIAVDSADQGIYGKLKAKYDAAGTKVSEKWSKLDKYQPNKVIKNMGTSDTLKFNYKQTAWGGQKIAGITMGNTSTLIESKTTAQKLLPGYDFVKGLRSENINVTQQYQTALKAGFRAQEVGPITRGLVAKEIRQKLGISLTAWTLAKYKNKTAEQARLQEARDAHEKVATKGQANPVTKVLQDGDKSVSDAQDEAIKDDKKLTAALDNGGVIDDSEKALSKSVTTSGFETAVGAFNGFYATAVPLCIVYDGSMNKAGPTIDAQRSTQMKTYQYVASAADQEKDGTDASELAVGALNRRLGDTSTSVAQIRATEPNNFSTAGSLGSQASPGGNFTLLDVLFAGIPGGAGASGTIEFAADHVCPALTDIRVATGTALVSLLATIFTGGTSQEAVSGVGTIATRIVERVTASFAERFGSRAALKETSGKTAALLKDAGKSGVKIAGVTILAKFIVAAQSGYLNNGIETNTELADSADSGGNQMANEVGRVQFYGRPLDKTETIQAADTSTRALASRNEGKSTYQRYFAISNPASLLTKIGAATTSGLHQTGVSSFSELGQKLLSPLSSLGSLLLNSNHNFALAASGNTTSTNYGNVQFDWSNEEQALAKKPEYGLLENQRILDAQESTVAEFSGAYSKCFDLNTTMGTMLSEGMILRDDNGNVTDDTGDPLDDKGLCSPNNLGPHNPRYGDLVFRWRLANRDDNGLATLDDQQNVIQDTTTTEGGGTIRIATYNVLGAAHTAGFKDRMDKTINTITSKGLDVVGLQEFEQPQRDYLLGHIGQTYDIWPQNWQAGGASVNSIIWNKSKFDLVDKGSQDGLKYFCGQNISPPWVKLQIKSGSEGAGQQFYVLNVHDPATSHKPHRCPEIAAKLRLDNARAHVVAMNQFESDNTPVFYTGDFNSAYTKNIITKNGGAYQNDDNNLTYCVMAVAGGMDDAYDAFRDRNAKCPNPLPAADSNLVLSKIDHIYMTPGLQVSNYFNIPKSQSGSDHNVVIADVVMSGTTTTTTRSNNSEAIDGILNFRDAAASNGTIRRNLLYRSSDLSKLTTNGSRSLASMLGDGSTIIDLRTPEQRQSAPDKVVPGSRTSQIPIGGILDQAAMVTDPTRRAQLAKALKTAGNANGTVLIHCTHGKDRTGWMVAMIMYISGANDRQVMDEYMKSSETYPNGVKEAWLNSGLDKIHNQYGSVNGYLKQGLGLSDSDIAKIRNKFKAG